MMRIGLSVVGCVLAGMVATNGLAQEAGGPAQPRPEARFGTLMAEATAKAVVSVATNATVAAELGLTEKQLAALRSGVDAEKVRRAQSAQRLAELVVSVLTDPKIAADLGLTQGQQQVIKQGMTAALIEKAFSPEEIERLSQSAGPGGMIRERMDAMRQQWQQGGRTGNGQGPDAGARGQRGARFGGRGQGGAPAEPMKQPGAGEGGKAPAEKKAPGEVL